jgi:hypothetical protein
MSAHGNFTQNSNSDFADEVDYSAVDDPEFELFGLRSRNEEVFWDGLQGTILKSIKEGEARKAPAPLGKGLGQLMKNKLKAGSPAGTLSTLQEERSKKEGEEGADSEPKLKRKLERKNSHAGLLGDALKKAGGGLLDNAAKIYVSPGGVPMPTRPCPSLTLPPPAHPPPPSPRRPPRTSSTRRTSATRRRARWCWRSSGTPRWATRSWRRCAPGRRRRRRRWS